MVTVYILKEQDIKYNFRQNKYKIRQDNKTIKYSQWITIYFCIFIVLIFLIQSVPSYSESKMVTMLKSITAKELFRLHPEIKEILWGGKFWTSGYYVNTVGQYSNEEVIRTYIKNQGKEKEYKKLHQEQLKLF